MDMLSLKDIAVIATPFLVFALGVVVAAVGFLLKGIIHGLKEELSSVATKAERLERDLMEFKAELPREYVTRDDFIRTVAGFDMKLDKMDKKIDTLMRRRATDEP